MYLIGIGGAWLLASRRMKRFDPTWTKERLPTPGLLSRLRRDPRWPPGYVLFHNLTSTSPTRR